MLIAGVSACTEIDIKKIVALSTLSQLGVIIVSLSLFRKNICFFHLVTHAIFKALLFICVGVAIHTIYGSQDFRSFRNLGKNVLYPIRFLIISNIALLGFPFIAGFYRKDIVIESFYSSYSCFLGVGLTTAYRVKITNLAGVGNNSGLPNNMGYGGLRWQVKVPLLFLGSCSVVRGFFIGGFMSVRVVLSIMDKIIPIIFILMGLILGVIVTNYKIKILDLCFGSGPVFK